MMLNDPTPRLDPKEDGIEIIRINRKGSVGILKDNITTKGIVLLSPVKVARLKEEDITAWIQRGLGSCAAYSDLAYANVGADIADDAFSVIQYSNIITKLEPFTLEEVTLLKPCQIIVSSVDLFNTSPDYFSILKEKNITAFSLDFIQDINGNSTLNDIFYREENAAGITASLGEFILPILISLASSGNLRNSIQTNPALLQGVYCYNGNIVKKEVADKYHLPWKDFFSLFWDLN